MPHRSSRATRLALLAALAFALGCPAGWAAPPTAASPPAASPPARPATPDYGGRTGSLGSALDGAADGGAVAAEAAPPDPLAQAGRAFEALVIVLAVVAGGLVLLKRSGVLKGDGAKSGWAAALVSRPTETATRATSGATEMLAVLGSQTLPHSPGAGLHLVAVGGRVLLLGATGQSVTLLTEVAEIAAPSPGQGRTEDTPEEVAAFADYLARVGVASPATAGPGASPSALTATTDRLRALVGGRQNGATRSGD